ncbi:hypothetical protein ARSEF4850_002515 [Beauveria asiatica]
MAYGKVPGLDKALTTADLEESRKMYVTFYVGNCQLTSPSYNGLPDDLEQPAILDTHVRELSGLFVRNNVHEIFGIHLVHGHFEIPEGGALVGTNYNAPRCRWARTTDVHRIDLDGVHGHIFVLTDHGFHPYEYQQGTGPDVSKVSENFLTELADFLVENDLAKLVGLQILDPHPSEMFELILPGGTIMVDASSLTGCIPTRRTGWRFGESNGQPRVCKPNETHAQHANGHDVFNAGAAHPQLATFEDVKHALQKENILCVV